MNKRRLRTALCGALFSLCLTAVLHAQENPGVQRTELERSPIPGTNYVAVVSMTEIDPGASASMHMHPGVEMGYVLSGTSTVSIKGQPDQVHKAGESFMVPANTPHRAVNSGTTVFKVLNTYVVEKDKPLRLPAP